MYSKTIQRNTPAVIITNQKFTSEINFVQMSPKSVFPPTQQVLGNFNIPGSKMIVTKVYCLLSSR